MGAARGPDLLSSPSLFLTPGVRRDWLTMKIMLSTTPHSEKWQEGAPRVIIGRISRWDSDLGAERENSLHEHLRGCWVVSNSLWPHGLRHTRLPCPSPSPRVCSNSCPLSYWCHRTISSSVPFTSCHQSFPESGSFPMSQFFASGGQSLGVSASASVLPRNIQDWFPSIQIFRYVYSHTHIHTCNRLLLIHKKRMKSCHL